MTPEQFTYWLQGFVELNEGKKPSDAQWKSIKEHIAEVFHKVTPPVGGDKRTLEYVPPRPSFEPPFLPDRPRVTCSKKENHYSGMLC